MWATKKTFEFPISAEKSLSILVKTSEFLRFCASNPPHQNFLDPPLPWLRLCLSVRPLALCHTVNQALVIVLRLQIGEMRT